MLSVGAIQVKNVPEELHDAIRRRAAKQGLTVSQFVLETLRREMAFPTMDEWLDEVATHEPVDLQGLDVAELIRQIREERDEELFRRFSGG